MGIGQSHLLVAGLVVFAAAALGVKKSGRIGEPEHTPPALPRSPHSGELSTGSVPALRAFCPRCKEDFLLEGSEGDKMNCRKRSRCDEAQAAQNRNPFLLDGDSRHWNEMSEPMQLGYLDGFIDGIRLGALHAVVECIVESHGATVPTSGVSKVNEIVAQFTAPGIPLDQIRAGIATICKRPENSWIEISGALRAFVMKVRGTPQSDIDDDLNFARQGVIIHPPRFK